jgi:hypothetical protein
VSAGVEAWGYIPPSAHRERQNFVAQVCSQVRRELWGLS